MSGKQTIIAWFKDKNSVLRWYYSDMHEGVISAFMSDADDTHKPMAHVPDDTGPIMVMATLTMTDKPQFEGLSIPVSQISIELFIGWSG